MAPNFSKMLQEAEAASLQRQQALAQFKLLQQKAQLTQAWIDQMKGGGALESTWDPSDYGKRNANRRPVAQLPPAAGTPEGEQPLPGNPGLGLEGEYPDFTLPPDFTQ